MDDSKESRADGAENGHAVPPVASLLDLARTKPQAAAARIYAIWEAQDATYRRHHAFWQRNKCWMAGYPGVSCVPKTSDLSDWDLNFAFGLSQMKPAGSLLSTYVRRLAAHMYVDEPIPQILPTQDGTSEDAASEFAERLLIEDGSLSGTNDTARFMLNSEKSSTFGSAFTYLWADPHGNGSRPMQMMAHPAAQTVEEAAIDPNTGQSVDENEMVPRYVKGDALTDVPAEADLQWLPKVCPYDISAHQVRPIPAVASHIDDCTGCMVLFPFTLGVLKETFPKMAELDIDDQQALVSWRPMAANWSLPWYAKRRNALPPGPDGEPNDDEYVWTIAWYHKSTPTYPKGGYVLTTGAKHVLYPTPEDGETAGEWSAMVETEDGQAPVLLDLPIAQWKSLNDVDHQSFVGKPLVDEMGAYDAMSVRIMDAALTHSWRFMYPHIFIPMGSNVQPEQLASRGVAPIQFNPAGKPEVEQVPDFDRTSVDLIGVAKEGMENTMGLRSPAQGAAVSNVTSARQGEQLIQQSYANIATIVQNQRRGIIRYWKIKLQLMRAFCTIPQLVKYVGEDGAYKEREWSSADLDGIMDVSIKIGSFTQLSPEDRETLIARWMTPLAPNLPPMLDFDEGQRLLSNSVNARMGRLDNPFRMRAKRQIAAWNDGPPEGWEEQQAAFMQAQQQVQAFTQQAAQEAEARGLTPEEVGPAIEQKSQQMMQAIQPPLNPFAPLPPDAEPPIAKIRHQEISRAIVSERFNKWSPAWQGLIVQAYNEARLAAGLLLPAEQAQQQAEQMQQQQMQQQAMDEKKDATGHAHDMAKDAQQSQNRSREQAEAAALAPTPQPQAA